MFFEDTTYDLIARGTILTAIGIVYVIALTRIVGLRSFSKMTNFDFVITVASGTVLAGMGRATDWQGFTQAAVVMFALFAVQFLIAMPPFFLCVVLGTGRWGLPLPSQKQGTPTATMS